MAQSLKQNMLEIEDVTMRNADVVDLEDRVKKALPSELRYACLYWTSHVTAIGHVEETCLSLLTEFTRERLLNWIEAMSFLGTVPRAIGMLKDMHEWAVS